MKNEITLTQFLECVNYKITEGSEYCWESFGPNARYLTCEHEENIYTVEIVFDFITLTVYQMWVHSNAGTRYWTHPDYRDAFNDEQITKNGFEQLINDEDNTYYLQAKSILDYARMLISKYLDDDNMSTIELDLTDSEILWLSMQAHEKNITLNELINNIIEEHINDAGCN